MIRSGFYPHYTNKCQKIYHECENKYKHHGDLFLKTFREEFVRLCVNDGVVSNKDEIIKPPSMILYT